MIYIYISDIYPIYIPYYPMWNPYVFSSKPGVSPWNAGQGAWWSLAFRGQIHGICGIRGIRGSGRRSSRHHWKSGGFQWISYGFYDVIWIWYGFYVDFRTSHFTLLKLNIYVQDDFKDWTELLCQDHSIHGLIFARRMDRRQAWHHRCIRPLDIWMSVKIQRSVAMFQR